jgi:hypothetical protein
MKFKQLPAKKLKILMALFFGSGIIGITIGLTYVVFMYTVMGVINLMIGALVGWMFLTREPRSTKKGKQ